MNGPTLGLFLILLFGIPRFIMVLHANQTGNYGAVSILFILMCLLPFILLSKEGRQKMGLVRPDSYSWLGLAFFAGLGLSLMAFLTGDFLYDNSISNWFVYISRSYNVPADGLDEFRFAYFLIFALTGMTFSPFGEEFLYRGVIHLSFAPGLGKRAASHIDSAAFAVTHLAHFGIVWSNEEWSFLVVPSILWMALIYLAGRLFYLCRERSGSILGAVVCHAAFNLGMIYCIFYFIL